MRYDSGFWKKRLNRAFKDWQRFGSSSRVADADDDHYLSSKKRTTLEEKKMINYFVKENLMAKKTDINTHYLVLDKGILYTMSSRLTW